MKAGTFLRASVLVTMSILFTSGLIQAQITANFSATPLSGCSPLVVRFSDLSTGAPTQWRWDLGNGTISVLQNPSATYFTPGKYTVRLVARNASGADSVVKTDYIEVFANPTVDFTASTTSGCYPLPVQFTDRSNPGSGTISSWLWDFGNGNTSTEQNPVQTYTSARSFSVTLQVRNSSGCIATITKPNLIDISSGVIAQFTNDNPATCTTPFTINFMNQSIGTGVLNYQWDFGDGGTSGLVSPSHTYTTNGTFTVKLIVTNSTGCTDTLIRPNAVAAGSVNADFADPGQVCQGAAVNFQNLSDPTPASVTWYFGDGTTSTQLDPVKTYNTAGTFTVKMVANFGACTDSMIRTVTVLPKPRAAFTTADTTSCKVPFTAAFTSQSTGAQQFQWTFGDNNSSTLENPANIYNNTGTFSVSLKVTAANGCTDSIQKPALIKIARPTVSLRGVPDSSCAPFSKSFSASVVVNEPVSSYLWNFGDGNTSTDAAPVYTYTTEGIFNVSLNITTISGCTGSASINRAIVTSSKPVVNFSADPLNACASSSITFTDLTPGTNRRWLWDFGDSTTSTQRNPVKLYQDTGYFDIKLKVWNGGCMDSLVKPMYVRINPPVAKFTVSLNCRRPFERTFTDNSIGADQWFWNFGDGNTSTARNPVYTYTSPGNYTVSLRVVNLSSGCEYTSTRQLQIISLRAQFTASDTAVCKGDRVIFTSGLNSADLTRSIWIYGDGSPTLNIPHANPVTHTYTRSGSYSVRLVVTDKNGCNDTLWKMHYIKVSGPTAAFAPASAGVCLNSLVNFNDNSTADSAYPLSQWQWNYGNGITEILNAPPFSHLYTTPGSYFVSLKVTDSKGCSDSIRMSTPVTISNPRADFSTVDTFTCPGKPVRFISQSTGTNLQYRWDFGDGNSSTSANPVHSYSANGTYSVTLRISDPNACADSITKTAYITITSPQANFIMSDSIGFCPPLLVHFTDQSVNAQSVRWDFGDSTYSTELNPVHFYNYPGIYTVRLTATGVGGCTNYYEKTVTVKGPEGSFTYAPQSGCNPVTVHFHGTTNSRNSFIWDFNDGNTYSTTDSLLTHTYSYPGRYVPKLILVDPAGCQVPIRGADTIVVGDITANFSFNTSLLCDSGIVRFTGTPVVLNDQIASYQWNFGDGETSTLSNPDHTYRSTGIFYPTLTVVTANGCTDSLRSATAVRVVKSPEIDIVFSGNGCAPLTATFSSRLVTPDTSVISWQWDFANGNTSTDANPAAQQFTTGSYPVRLSGTNSSGCTGSISRQVEAYAIPVVNAGTDLILCKGSSRSLQASGADNYSWAPGTALDCTNCASPSTTTDNNITYVVTGTTIHGCTGTDSVTVTVKEKIRLTYSNSDSLCRGSSKKLSAAGADSYTWTPSAGLDNPAVAEPTATPDTTTTYRVVGADNVGCFKDTGYINIRVSPIPMVDAGPDKTVNVGSTLDLMPVISPDVTEVIWQPTTGLFRNEYPGITVKPTENTEYTVEVKNRGGCRAKDYVTVFVVCNGSNIFVPNTFSPNNDGTNDVFFPRGTGVFKIRSLRIFTRWGELIWDRSNFDANNPAYGWNGTNKGMQLNPDVFIYTLEIMCDNGSVITHRGNIALVK